MPRDAHPVLVTGGLGFIGSRLCEELLRRGRRVLCVDDLRGVYAPSTGPAAVEPLRALGAEVVLTDAANVPFCGIGAVIHLAGLPGVRSRRPADEVRESNAVLSRHLVEAAAAAGARFVLGSTSSVYGDAARLPTPEHSPPAPLNAYACSKLAAELAVREAALRRGADASIVRMFTVYGPGQRPDMAFARWIRALLAEIPLPWCAPAGAARDFTYVDDAVSGLIAALDRGRPAEAYNVSGGRGVPVDEALTLLEEELRVSRTGLESRVSPATEARVTAGCGRKATVELGYTPRVGLAEGLRLQVEATLAASPARRPFEPRRAPLGRHPSGRGSRAGARGSGLPLPAGPPAAATSPG